MIKTINTPFNQFSVSESLLYICKKPSGETQSKAQIDFLLLDQQIQQLHNIQSKTCEQIVEFVDEHRQDFIEISNRFKLIEGQVSSSEQILRNLIIQITSYKEKHFSQEGQIQKYISEYQKKLIHNKLITLAKQQTQFLMEFVNQFDQFINVNVEDLSHWQKYYIVRLLKKSQYFKNLFGHPLVKMADQQYNGIDNLLENIIEELNFYLSEQLSRLISNKQLYNIQQVPGLTLLEEIQNWYEYHNQVDNFYETAEETLLTRQLPTLESLLLSNKQSLLTGKQQSILNQFYQNLFGLVNNFPDSHPPHRILKLVYKFLSRKQLNFQYSYVVPTFAISYSAYKNSINIIKNQQIRKQLQLKHNWKLSLWAELRIKSILDRSHKDYNVKLNGSLIKWIQIILKKGFMIKGVKSYMIKLVMILTNKYCSQLQSTEFTIDILNQFIQQMDNVQEVTNRKLLEAFKEQLDEQQLQNSNITLKNIKSVVNNINDSIKKSISSWTHKNIALIITNCKNSFDNYKSFVMKIVNKKDKGKVQINKRQNIMKPLDGFIKNNPEISEKSIQLLYEIVQLDLVKFYDEQYAKDIFNHSNHNLTTNQLQNVMEVLSSQRKSFFDEYNEQ